MGIHLLTYLSYSSLDGPQCINILPPSGYVFLKILRPMTVPSRSALVLMMCYPDLQLFLGLEIAPLAIQCLACIEWNLFNSVEPDGSAEILTRLIDCH